MLFVKLNIWKFAVVTVCFVFSVHIGVLFFKANCTVMCEESVLARRHTNTFGKLVINHSVTTSHQKPARSFHSNQRSRKCFQLKWNISASFYNNKTYMGCKFITNDKLVGRTGNQMFQIASVIGLAYKYDLIPLLKNVKPVSDIFDLPNKATITLARTALMDFSVNCCKYDSKVEHIRPDKNWTIAGFLQTYKYFNPIRDIVSGVFKFHENIMKSADGYIKKVSERGADNVCIHVRRGDHLSSEAKEFGYTPTDINYIRDAISFFLMSSIKTQFIFLSDDILWCKKNFRFSNFVVHFSPFEDAGKDMAFMSLCDHVVITSGSFGWWGAWLSERVAIYYKGFPARNTTLWRQFSFPDYYPSDWIGLT